MSTKKNLTVFGYGLGIIALIFGLGGWHKHGFQLQTIVLLICSVIFLSTAWLNYMAYKPAYEMWMKVAHIIGAVVTTGILTLVFFLVFFPTGLVLRLFGKDHLERKIDLKIASYWHKRQQHPFSKERYQQQF